MTGRNSMRLQSGLQVQIEIRRINADKYRRFLAQEMTSQFASNADDFTVMADDLNIAANLKFFHLIQGFNTCGHHFGTADTDKTCTGMTFAQCSDQGRSEQISRGFPRDYSHQQPVCRHGISHDGSADDAATGNGQEIRQRFQFGKLPCFTVNGDAGLLE